MSDTEKTWLDEDGRHTRLDDYLVSHEGWSDLVEQLADEAGITEEQAARLTALANIRVVASGIESLVGAFNEMAEAFNRMSAAYSDHQAEVRRNRPMVEEALEIMRRQIDEADGNAPWKDDDEP